MQSDCDQSELRSHAITVFRFSVTELPRTAQRVGQYTKLNMPVLTGYVINEFQECGMEQANGNSAGCNQRISPSVGDT